MKKKKTKKKAAKKMVREKVTGEPMPVKPCSKDVAEKALQQIFNDNRMIYPRMIINENWWTKFKRLLGLVP